MAAIVAPVVPHGLSELSIEEVREVQLGVLAEFDRVCRSHGLIYYVAYGTLLGAVRHGGYIPWDDDIDVMMPRSDYDQLPDTFQSAASPHLSLCSPGTRADWPFPYAKIGDDRTELWEPLEDPLPLAVNLDVFPIDALPSSRLARRVLWLLRWAVELRYVAVAHGRGWHHPLAMAVGKPILRLSCASSTYECSPPRNPVRCSPWSTATTANFHPKSNAPRGMPSPPPGAQRGATSDPARTIRRELTEGHHRLL